MPFRLSSGSRDWFRHLIDAFDVQFDIYYMGAIVGLLEGRKGEVTASSAPELVEYFPELHRPYGNILVGLLMAAELRASGLHLRDKKLVHTVVGELVDPKAPSHLSDRGFAAMNEYAEGGIQTMKAWFEDPPRIKSVFLLRYVERVQGVGPAAIPV